jgi:cytidine deaminase
MKMKQNINININIRSLSYMKYTNFQIGSSIKSLQFYYHNIYIYLEENMFRSPCGFANQIQPMSKHSKKPNA